MFKIINQFISEDEWGVMFVYDETPTKLTSKSKVSFVLIELVKLAS